MTKVTSQKTNKGLIDKFDSLQKWIDINIMPILAIPALAILSADDIRSHLQHLSPSAALTVATIIAAILAVKAHH